MTPLIVYIPNSPYVYHSNVSTFDPSYETNERNDMILNGYSVATMGNATIESTWPTCVGCAVLQRSLERTKTPVPDVCTTCFKKFCWDGTVNSTTPALYDPPFKVGEVDAKSGGSQLRSKQGGVVTVVSGLVLMAFMVVW